MYGFIYILHPDDKNDMIRIFRLLFIAGLLFHALLTYGQEDKALKGKPKTLEETFPYLDQIIGDMVKYNFIILPEDVAVGRLHFPFGMWIRNEWGLWKNSDLKKYFVEKGIGHPDDMTGIIFTSYHRYLNNKPIDLEGQIERNRRIYETMIVDTFPNGKIKSVSYPELAKGMTSQDELLSYYEINDTVIFNLTGRKGLLKKHISVRSVGQIVGYDDKKQLLVRIVEIILEKNVSTDYQVGEQIDINPYSCYLIPPNNWK